MSTLSAYEYNSRNLRRSLDILLDQYAALFISGKDTRFVRSQILAHDRLLKTDSVISRHRYEWGLSNIFFHRMQNVPPLLLHHFRLR